MELGCAARLGVSNLGRKALCGTGLHREWEGAWTRFWVGIRVSGTSEVGLLSVKPRHGSFNGKECVWCHCLGQGSGPQVAVAVC